MSVFACGYFLAAVRGIGDDYSRRHFGIGFRKAVWYTFIHQDAGGYGLACRKTNVVGKPYEEKPHVRFDVAGSGTQDTGNP